MLRVPGVDRWRQCPVGHLAAYNLSLCDCIVKTRSFPRSGQDVTEALGRHCLNVRRTLSDTAAHRLAKRSLHVCRVPWMTLNWTWTNSPIPLFRFSAHG